MSKENQISASPLDMFRVENPGGGFENLPLEEVGNSVIEETPEATFDSLPEDTENVEIAEVSPEKAKSDGVSINKVGEEVPESNEFSFSPIINTLVESGVLTIEEGKDYEDSELGFKEILEFTANKKAEELRAKELEDVPEYYKELLELAKKGVDPTEIIKIDQGAINYNEIDIEDQDNQKELYKEYLKFTGIEDEEVEDFVDTAEASGTLEKYAKTAQKILAKEQDKNREAVIQQQIEAVEKEKAESVKRYEDFKKDILNTSEVKGIKISKDESAKLLDFMTVPVDKKTGKTAEQLAWEDPETRKAFSYMVMNKFSLDKIEKQVTTKKTIELKKKLAEYKDTNSSSRGTQVIEDAPVKGLTRPLWG